MAHQVVEIVCPGCGGRVSASQKICDWCSNPVIVSTFNSVISIPQPRLNEVAKGYNNAWSANPENKELSGAVAMCYLKLGIYEKALSAFEKAIEDNFDNSEMYFYAAVCLLQGKKAFLHQRPVIDKILEYMSAATMIEPRGIYYYFMAYIKYDYFSRKYLTTSPNYKDMLNMAKQHEYSEFDVQQLFSILKVEKPGALA